MKKTALLSFFYLIYSISFSQIDYVFMPQEAKEMIAICNSFTFLDLYGSDKEIIPKGYKKEYTSGIHGMDNKFQVYTKGKTGIINLRGSTDKMMSWMENIYSAMIPAQGSIKMQDSKFDYIFAKDTAAAVHAGYALGIAFLSESLVFQIKYLNAMGIYDFILTGHSQGGSLAIMLRAYLENLPKEVISPKNKFKNYVFAHPMVGNRVFAEEYVQRFSSNNSNFSIINSADPIPKLPVTYVEGNFFSAENISSFFDNGTIDKRSVLMSLFMQKYEPTVTSYVQSISKSLTNQITNELGKVDMPEYVEDINYKPIEPRNVITPFEYPKILKDSAILQNDSLMAIYKRGSNGYFLDKRLYKKPPTFFQHKPYNYYVAILKKYFPDEYASLPKKYLDENL
ncbi:MAG: hypothetical protein OEX22_07480 [Cyclobacteriaceae bacterium]|nr:hypothetical protein [Cyclobacteriaceae bacterium]